MTLGGVFVCVLLCVLSAAISSIVTVVVIIRKGLSLAKEKQSAEDDVRKVIALSQTEAPDA